MIRGGWIQTPVSDDAPVRLHAGEFVIRVGSPVTPEILRRLLGDPLVEDDE